MKKQILLTLILTLFIKFMATSEEKIDITQKPEPLAEKEFVFPKYSETNLKNGVKVFLVEDHEQPTFAFRILIPGGSAYDGDKPGLAELTAEMLTKGAGKLTALQIAQKLDGVGANLSVSASPEYFLVSGNCIIKHIPLLLDVLSDVLLRPTFPKEELDKLKPRVIAGIRNEKSRGSVIANALTKKIVYGEKHPYGIRKTEESVSNITIDDISEFYQKYFKPDWASLVITGDVSLQEIIPLFDKALANWKKGNIPPLTFPPTSPSPLGVYFVKRPASVQSSIILSTPTVEIKNPDYETLDLAASVIGSGFAGRLFRTLRETYSYTYTPFGYQTSSKFANRFACGAEVRNAVTDSAIDVIKEQLYLLATEPPSEEELNRIKKVEIGHYLMSFENTDFIASLIQNAYFNGIPLAELKDYPKRVQNMTPYDIQKVAKKYMHPDKAYIVVVGNPDVKSKLEKFGKIFEYDIDLNPVSGEKAKMEKVSLDPDELIEKYLDARGGKTFLENLQSYSLEGKASLSFQGQVANGTVTQKIKSPTKKYQKIDFGMFQSELWVNQNEAWSKVQGPVEKLEPKEFDKALFDIAINKEIDKLGKNFQINILGKQGGQILVKFTTPSGFEATTYFNASNYLIEKIESTEDTPQGPIPVTTTFEKWEKIDNYYFPMLVKTTNPMFDMEVENAYQLNVPFDDNTFTPNK
jgi:predicted Zn-dependent peptidase